jgi:L-rhamnose mutarotase
MPASHGLPDCYNDGRLIGDSIKKMKTYCLALDLKDDPALIADYKKYHQPEQVWPEVISSIRDQGILSQQIYLLGTRLVMVLQTTDDFSWEEKSAADQENLKVQQWEALMWKYQKPLPQARPGEKWIPMEKIFEVE